MKALSPAAVQALEGALSTIYWYKNDLKTFLFQVCDANDHDFIARLDWERPKRQVVSDLIRAMTRGSPRHQETLLDMLLAVCDFDEFSHLERLDDGEEKAAQARAAVERARLRTESYRDALAKDEMARRALKREAGKAEANRALQSELKKLEERYLNLVTNRVRTPQQRGYDLEQLLADTFELFDLDPRKPFRTEADQIDGAFTLDGGEYLLSARWTKDPVGLEDLGAFKSKVDSRLENTLGLYVSINGYAAAALNRFNANNPSVFLADGGDIYAVFEGRIALPRLLRRKRRHAAQTGEVYLPVARLI